MSEELKLARSSSILHANAKIDALEKTLLQSLKDFKDLVTLFEEISTESDCYKNQVFTQKEKCESQSCDSSEALKKIIALRDDTIQSIGNLLLELNETKDFNIINDVFRIIYGESLPLKKEITSEDKLSPKSENLSEQNVDDNFPLSSQDDCEVEIIGLHSGRKSPIFESKKLRNALCSSTNNVKLQEKKKCPGTWPTPDKKTVKLSFPTPAKGQSYGKFRQARLSFVKAKTEKVVDLTCSPTATESPCESNLKGKSGFWDCMIVPPLGTGRGDTKKSGTEWHNLKLKHNVLSVLPKVIKKECIESDDTILPSPTSGPINFTSIYKAAVKSSPYKQKKSLSILKLKSKEETSGSVENKENKSIERCDDPIDGDMNVLKESNKCNNSPIKMKNALSIPKSKTECTTFFIDDNDENILNDRTLNNEMEESVDILKDFPNRFSTSPKKQQNSIPTKAQQILGDESISLLHRVNKIDDILCTPCGPSKRPSSQNEIPPSMSVLASHLISRGTSSNGIVKRTKPDPVEPIFKEPTVRKKADKLALPGWSCEECKEFYAELYKDDPEMLRAKMEACSRHRAHRDPTRPTTPPGFWQMRWHVPENTDDFNRRNDAS